MAPELGVANLDYACGARNTIRFVTRGAGFKDQIKEVALPKVRSNTDARLVAVAVDLIDGGAERANAKILLRNDPPGQVPCCVGGVFESRHAAEIVGICIDGNNASASPFPC